MLFVIHEKHAKSRKLPHLPCILPNAITVSVGIDFRSGFDTVHTLACMQKGGS